MAIVATQGSFNTGRDCTIVLVGPAGQVQLDNVTGFNSQQITVGVKVDRLDGVQLDAELPKGWSGSLDVDRGSNSLDVLFANAEQAWINGGSYQLSTMYQYVAEADGSTTTFAYDNVALKLADAGNYAPDAVVKQRITFTANRRRIV
jgi:hypothetical protein